VTPVAAPVRNAWDVVVAFFRLDAIDDLSYPASFVFRFLSPLISVCLYFFQAQFLDRNDAYTATLVGVSVALALQMALSGFGGRLQLVQDRGTLEPVLVEPVPWWTLPLTMNIWLSLTGVVTMALMLGTGLALGADINVGGLPAFAVILLLGILACNAIGILSGSLLVLAKKAGAVLALYGLAASLLGGALFSIDVLPAWLRPLSYLVPHAYVISASREVLVPGQLGTGMSLPTAILGLVLFIAVAYPLGLYAFSKSLNCARRMDLLGGY
jgi:ABC-2 type transport system permease protein